MRFHARFWLLASLTGVLISLYAAPIAQAAEAPAIEKLAAVNCSEGHEQCAHKVVEIKTVPFGTKKYSITEEPGVAEAEAEGFTQAGGHVPFGITDFTLAHEADPAHPGENHLPFEKPTATVQHIRTDVAPGLATSPAAVPFCSTAQFGKEELPGTGLFAAPACPEGAEETRIGVQQATVYLEAAHLDVALEGPVFNLEPPKGRASLFGVSVALPIPITKGELEKAFAEKGHPLGKPTEEFLEAKQYYAHTLIEGNVEWGQEAAGTNQGDYHDYFEIAVSPALPLVSSRLVFYGRRGGQFITNATSCPGHLTTRLLIEDLEKVPATRGFTSPLPLSKCNEVPFEPLFSVAPATTAQDEPNGFSAELGLVRHPEAEVVDASQLKTAVFKLPEGMTLNESAAAGLTACSPAEARIHSPVAGVGCASTSEIGKVTLEVPTLPPGSLKGSIFLGGPESGPITGPPYIVYLDAESARYGVSVRIKGETTPNETTGQLTTVFSENPEQPFTKVTLAFKQGALAPIANPLVCGPAKTETSLVPFSGNAAKEPFSEFVVDSNNAKGACPSPLPFAPTQTTQNQSANAGGHTSYTFNLERSGGQQNLSEVKTVLPPGLVGAIPVVTPCAEPQAAQGTCTSASQIGTARVLAGAGPTPYAFSGPVYLTGPYKGAPYGMSIAVPAIAGPFNLGTVVTRATINVNQSTAQVTVASVLPRIVKGVPVRFRRISIAIEKQGFLFNPTNCSASATESSVTSFIPGSSASSTVNLSSPFQVGNCGALAFKPTYKFTTSARTSKANGASLETTLNTVPGQANVKSVLVQLPKQLPSRLTTLQKACLQATFEANPFGCPSGSYVGGVRANTPALPDKMKGPAVLVSHGGAAFPDLDLVLEADGVRVILVGNTDIKNGITKTNFASTPDVPVSSVTVNLPIGPHSALGAFGDLCATPLVIPTTITGQNGKVIKQNTKINVSGCGVKIVGHKVIGNTAYLTIKTFAAGRISASGSQLGNVVRHLNGAVNATTLKVPLRRGAHRPLTTRIRVGFVPKRKGPSSAAFVTVRFR
jgi:hypothetical protein